MKKTLLSILAGVAVIGSASAVPSPSDRKALCEQNPEKFVWVEKTQACIPVNPCLSDNADIKNAYCDDTTFANISLSNLVAIQAAEITHLYRKCLLGIEIPGGWPVKYPSLSEPNYLATHYVGDGIYRVYKFASLDVNRSSAVEFLNAVCNAIGGADTGEVFYNDAGFASIRCKSSCQGTYKLLEDTMNFRFDYKTDYDNNQITISFKSEQDCYSYDDCIKK